MNKILHKTYLKRYKPVIFLSPVFWAQLSKLSVQYYLRSPSVYKTYTLSWKLWHRIKISFAIYCRNSLKPAENSSWHWMFYARVTRSIPIEDIPVQNIRLHFQENTLTPIASVLYPLLFLCFVLVSFSSANVLMLSKMHLVISQKYFKFFICHVCLQFCLLTYFKLFCSPSLMGQLLFQRERTITI